MATTEAETGVGAHVEGLRSDGYTVLRGVHDDERLAPLRDLTDRIAAYADLDLHDPFSAYYLEHRNDQGTLYDLYQRHPEFRPLAESADVLRVLEQVVGRDIFMYENSLVAKPKGRANAVPWHQDFISRSDEPQKYISWTALDDVHTGNGAMSAIPGSHRNGYLEWFRVRGETHHDRLVDGQVDPDEAVVLEMRAGDVLVFDARLVHGSPECHSDEPRRGYRVSFQGFETVSTPRGAPIVVWGGAPESVAEWFPQPRRSPPAWRAFVRKIGRRLSTI